jgi:undecaprenyl diphosphate synthase
MLPFLKRKEENKLKYSHVAMDIKGVANWCEKNKVSLEDGYIKSLARVREIIEIQGEQKIPILSFLILSLDEERKTELLKCFKEFVEGDFLKNYLREKEVRVTLLGKWYDLPSELLDSLKRTVEETKDNDNLFLNFCLNYDGQEELVDAFKIIARQLMAGKLDVSNITKETIKENVYSSYFPAPNLVIRNGDNKADSFFLWDGVGAKSVFTGKDFPDFSKGDFEKILVR